MRKAFQYRIYLTNGQRRLLEQQLKECRWLWNTLLGIEKDTHESGGGYLSAYDLTALLPPLKKERPSLKLVNAQALQNVAHRVDLAFQAFFRRVREGVNPDEVGYPRFKGFGRYDSITFPQYGRLKAGLWLDKADLIVPKLGRVHVVMHRPVEGKIKTVTLRRAATGKWYASFSCEVEPKLLAELPDAVGVDVGLESFATLADGPDWHVKIDNPRFFRRDEADLKRVQKLKDAAKNRQDWTENKRRTKALARIHERIRFRRENFAHQYARILVDHFQLIAFEELEPQQMGNSRGMRKSIADVAWSQFVQHTCAKAEEAGRMVVLIDPRNTSKLCSRCGKLVEKRLSTRVHECPYCGLVLDRDHNAAINILARGLQQLRL